MSADTFASRLQRALRRSALETQRALAEESGIDVTYLSRLWTGKVERPTYEIVYKLATALRCSVTDLAPWFEVADVPRQPVPPAFDVALPDALTPSDAEVIAFAESIADPAIRYDLQEFRDNLSDAEYLHVCRRFYRILVPAGRAVLAAERA